MDQSWGSSTLVHELSLYVGKQNANVHGAGAGTGVGAGHGVGGIGVGAGGAVTRPLVFPAAATMVVFDDLNQHWPRLNVKNTHPFARHSALAQAMQHEDTLSAAMLPSPASWGLMSHHRR